MIAGIVAGQAMSAPAGPTDPYWSSVSMLLHMNGADGGTSFPDNSPTHRAVSANGNAQTSISQKKFGSASALFDGSGDYLTSSPDAGFDLSGDFTIECFVRLNAYSASWGAAGYGATIVSTYVGSSGAPRGWQVRINGTASSYDTVNVYTGDNDLNFAYSFSLNTWYHVAVCRVSGQIRTFVDGTQAGSTVPNSDSFGGSVAASKPLYIGGLNDSLFRLYLNGYLDELRLTKGVGRYSSNFTPPSDPFPNS